MSRYHVTLTPDRTRWVILDRLLGGYCTLPDAPGQHPNLLPLEWTTEDGAQGWMRHCYRRWDAGTVPAPKGWRPLPVSVSPWA